MLEQLSVAVAEKVTVAPHFPGSFGFTILAGHVTTGGCVSLTVTRKEQESEPAAFTAVEVTRVTPTGNTNGDVIALFPIRYDSVDVGLPFESIAAKATDAEQSPALLLTVVSAGQ